jgi:hypothetical protein
MSSLVEVTHGSNICVVNLLSIPAIEDCPVAFLMCQSCSQDPSEVKHAL